MENLFEKAKKYIDDNWHRLPKNWNKDSMALLMNGYMKECVREIKKPLYSEITKNELPVNIISYLSELHKNGGSLNYGIGRFPVSISNLIDEDWVEALKKVPKDFYYLWKNAL
jgi:hypothetical protein